MPANRCTEQGSDAKSTGTAELGLFRHANQDSGEDYASSVRLNTLALIATVWYAFSLASSIIQGELPFQTGNLRV